MTESTFELLQSAQTYVKANNLIAASECVEAALKIEPRSLKAHNLREKYRLSGNFSDWMGVDAQISEDDDIFRFFSNHPTSTNPVRDYLSDGWRTTIELQETLDMCSLSLRQCTSFLEFASGHGRFTRHLSRIMKRGQLTVSDVVPGSVEFLANTFGVKGFTSTTDPLALALPGKYQVIFVLSLFTHLPTPIWQAWFKVLAAALEPGGVLIFSTHGEKSARKDGVNWGEKEHAFFAASESSALDGQTYGCTYASLNFVKSQLAQALGSGIKINSIAGHFWGAQDAIIVSN
jgi:SAM-dependent methyltransferase